MDYFDRTGTGSGCGNNQDSYFSPQFTFGSGGGSAVFNFEFVLGGSYNNSANLGTLVVLQNVRLNTSSRKSISATTSLKLTTSGNSILLKFALVG